ncbi:S9 family peptidase [Flavobacterium soli]|uniref:S9 family peptidase n=1 Tax=Flavobacterium soli TaxID=344881 RepID=UPI00041190DA|nr:prolyl oligopeptidase family serine peptidase [Flavobacterium soli]MBN8642891.1 prolyl oligopeptidase family serine peptidase [Flavobacteriales bacterium]
MRAPFFPTFYGVIAIILVGLVPCPVMGQVLTKKHVTEADYGLWHRMIQEQLSDNGNWVSYRFLYSNSIDTTFVVQTKTMKKFIFPNAVSGQFDGEKSFAFIKKEGLVLFDLKSCTEKLLPNVSRFAFSADGLYLVTLENASTLVIRKNETIVERIENVTTYEWNNDKTKLVYATSTTGNGSVGSLNFKNTFSKQEILKPTKQTFEVFKWQNNENSVAFYGIDKGNEAVFYYNFGTSQLFTLNSSDAIFPSQLKIAPDQNIELKVSRDGKKVFFGVSSVVAKDTTQYSSGVEVWHTKDKVLYRERAMRASLAYPQFLAVWLPIEKIVRQLNSEQQKWVVLNGTQDYALVAAIDQYEPQYKCYASMDFYLMDIRTGEKELVLKEQTGYDSQMDFSPDGRYISYYNNSNWWLYDIVKKSHINITHGLNASWDNRINDPAQELRLWGQTDWTKDGKFILCYDYHDIWAISLDGKQRMRLTIGKEKNLRFRFDTSSISNVEEFNYSNTGTFIYDLSKELILTAFDLYSGARGYYQLQPNKKPQALIVEDGMVTKYTKSKKGSAFICVKQRFDLPPTLVFQNNGLSKIIAQSNAHQKKYHWGKSEMIHYADSKGTPLNGALYYPANYDGTKKVPLVVYIYEVVSSDVHKHVNPSYDNIIGFNISNLTTNGYAVLLADIAYEKGNTGVSAADCVTAGATKVIQMGVADEKRIGLFGHSFGGYETNFILTQTDLFATAISGNGISDVVTHYFNYNNDWGSIDSWRYENQQWRMGFPFFDNKEAYYSNSPIQNADKITTPLLTWTGKLDQNIRPEQSEAFYAAFRRLKKENVMLVYSSDGHVLFNPNNQKDLTLKVKDWFGHYLKDEPKKEWMKADFVTN